MSSSSSIDTNPSITAASLVTAAPGVALLANVSTQGVGVAPMCLTEVRYKENNQSLKTLVTLCRGVKDEEGNPLIDLKSYPWNKLKASLIKPNVRDYRHEIERRWEIRTACVSSLRSPSVKAPQPKGWKTDKVLTWLDTHPIDSPEDVKYMTIIVHNRKANADQAAKDIAKENKEDQEFSSWSGKYPYLRLIHCLIDHDDIKSAYLRRNDIPSGRLHLDSRNSVEKRSLTVWEMISSKYNDVRYSPVTEEILSLHSDFFESETLWHDLVKNKAPATPEKCQAKFSSMMISLKRSKEKWERSGQGDGGKKDEEGSDDNGNNEPDEEVALDDRHSFFQYNQSYLLYLWHMLDKHGLYVSAAQELDDEVAADNGGGGVPSVVTRRTTSTARADDTGGDDGGTKGDDGAASWDSTLRSNFVDLTGLQDSISNLAAKAITAVSMQAEQQEKNRIQELEENERNRVHKSVHILRENIQKLKSEKRRLAHELVAEVSSPTKKNKAMIELLQEQIEEVERDRSQQEQEMNTLLATPRKTNRTPDSARLVRAGEN